MIRTFRQKHIDTFASVGDPGRDSPMQYKLADQRADRTAKLMRKWGIEPKDILDVAGPSRVGDRIARNLDIHRCYLTRRDLDSDWYPSTSHADCVLMLEVIEHLFNPLKFLRELRETVEFKDMIVSWPSRPSWLWTNVHYHELRLDRFELLCREAGYEIIHIHKGTVPETWYNRFKGIRPFIRSFVNTHYIVHIR